MSAIFLAMVWHARRRQVAVDALARAAAREREFARDASHELRTPITIARGHAELVREGVAGFDEAHDIDVVLDELYRLARITARLLAIAAVEQGHALACAPVEIREVLEETVARWRAAAPRAWSCEIAADGLLHADASRLTCAIDALVENAIAATVAGDAISVGCRAADTTLRIEIRDDGRGIAPEDLTRVFERFARVVPADAAAAEGTGVSGSRSSGRSSRRTAARSP